MVAPAPAVATPPGGPTALRPGARLRTVDFWRGVALLSIFVNHLPASPPQGATLKPHGFSDTAAWFFLLSGFVARLVYRKQIAQHGLARAAALIARRCLQLYLCQLLLSGLYIAAALYLRPGAGPAPWWAGEPAFQLAAHDPGAAAGAALQLGLDGFCIDILPTYLVILALFLGTLAAEHWWRVPPLAVGVGLYGAVQLGVVPGFGTWSFNPFAWQLLFHLGGWLYDHRQHLVSASPATALVRAAAWGTLLACALARHADLLPMPWAYWVSLLAPARGKALLEWPYLLHALVTMYCCAGLVSEAAVARLAPLRWIAATGEKPLPLFVFTTALAYLAFCLHGDRIGVLSALGYLAGGLLAFAAGRRGLAAAGGGKSPSGARPAPG